MMEIRNAPAGFVIISMVLALALSGCDKDYCAAACDVISLCTLTGSKAGPLEERVCSGDASYCEPPWGAPNLAEFPDSADEQADCLSKLVNDIAVNWTYEDGDYPDDLLQDQRYQSQFCARVQQVLDGQTGNEFTEFWTRVMTQRCHL